MARNWSRTKLTNEIDSAQSEETPTPEDPYLWGMIFFIRYNFAVPLVISSVIKGTIIYPHEFVLKKQYEVKYKLSNYDI